MAGLLDTPPSGQFKRVQSSVYSGYPPSLLSSLGGTVLSTMKADYMLHRTCASSP